MTKIPGESFHCLPTGGHTFEIRVESSPIGKLIWDGGEHFTADIADAQSSGFVIFSLALVDSILTSVNREIPKISHKERSTPFQGLQVTTEIKRRDSDTYVITCNDRSLGNWGEIGTLTSDGYPGDWNVLLWVPDSQSVKIPLEIFKSINDQKTVFSRK